MASGAQSLYRGGSLPSKKAPSTSYRRGFLSSDTRFPMPAMEECQFLVRLNQETKERLWVSEDEEEDEDEKKMEGELVTLLVQTDRLVVVRRGRSWGWKLGCIRRYGCSDSNFYFESGRKARTGEGVFSFDTDIGEMIHSMITMVKEFCQFDLYCQRGVIPDLLLVQNEPNRSTSFKERNEKQHDKKETNTRRVSTGSLPY